VGNSIAILGGSGFVGSSLAAHLSYAFDVTILDRVQPKSPGLAFKPCDIRDRQSLVDAIRGFDIVINTAIIQVPEITEKKRLGYEVNVLGVRNLCEAVESVDSVKGLLHASSWHVFGERDLRGTLNEQFGYRPDKVDERARFYAMCKIAQELHIRTTSEVSSKSFGIIRLGTVLGEGMPRLTAANIFIDKALKGEPMTPFAHTQHRPMLYVSIQDICNAFEALSRRILEGEVGHETSGAEVVNVVWPSPVTIIELARIVRAKVIRLTRGKIRPEIETVDTGVPPLFTAKDKGLFRVDISKARKLLGSKKLTSPRQVIEEIIDKRAIAAK
jgi:nucleoside-diphosphate-sugar epimerase